MDKYFWHSNRRAEDILRTLKEYAEFLVIKLTKKETWWDVRKLMSGAVDCVEVQLPDEREFISVTVLPKQAEEFRSVMQRHGRDCWQVSADGKITLEHDVVPIQSCCFKRTGFPNLSNLAHEFLGEIVRHLVLASKLSREFLVEKTYDPESTDDVVRDYDSRTAPPDIPLVWPLTLHSPAGKEYFLCSFHQHRQICVPYLEEYCAATKKGLAEIGSDGNVVLNGQRYALMSFSVTHEKPIRKPPMFKRKRRRNVVELALQATESKRVCNKTVLQFDFPDDESRHDDDLQEAARDHFDKQFREALDELIMMYGKPIETGEDDHELIPLGGVFHYAVWNVEYGKLFLAVAHEDRELPLWLKVGVSR